MLLADTAIVTAAHDQNLVTEKLLQTVIPLGRVNVVALIFAPLALAFVARGRLDVADLRVWVVAIWLGAAAQATVLTSRRWTGLTQMWETSYTLVMLFLGATWGSVLTVGVADADPLSAQLIIVCFMVMTSAASIMAFAGSLRLGLTFLLSQWGVAVTVALLGSHWNLLIISLTVVVAGTAYHVAANRFLLVSVNAQVRAHELSEELRVHATTDALTGLMNRRAVVEALEKILAAGIRPVVLFVDLDGFKAINDSAGHRAGDEVLIECGRRLVSIVRPGDLVGRLGGDEFVVVLFGGADKELSVELARRVTTLLARPVGDQGLRVTASVGCALPMPRESADRVLGRADAAMYTAKKEGGDNVVVSGTGAISANVVTRLRA